MSLAYVGQPGRLEWLLGNTLKPWDMASRHRLDPRKQCFKVIFPAARRMMETGGIIVGNETIRDSIRKNIIGAKLGGHFSLIRKV